MMTRQTITSPLNIESIFREYGKGLYSFLYRMSGNRHDAEDLTQETFVTVMQKLPSFKGKSSLKTWIYSVAVNKYRDSLRYGKIRAHEPMAEREMISPQNPLDVLIAKKTSDRLRAAFYGLAEHYRVSFSLVRFEGMTYKDAAAALGTTPDTVRMRVHRAHLTLAEQLKDPQ